MDDLVTVWLLPIGGLMITIFIGRVLDKEISREEFCTGTAYKWLWSPWMFFMRWIAPVAIACIILQQSGIINIDSAFSIVSNERMETAKEP